ncbi:MAG: sensor histidine kinase [Frankia sp.]
MIDGWRYVRDHPPTDAVVAVLLLALSVPGSVLSTPHSTDQVEWWPAVLLAGIACAALLLHRGHPRLTVAVTTACAVSVAALGYLLTVLLLAPLMAALYWLGAYRGWKTTYAYTIVAATLVVGTTVVVGPAEIPLELKTIGPTAWLLLPAALGTSARLQRAYLEAERVRAEQAERTREELAGHRVADERMRIARELHDVVAHHLALANAQAGTAAHLIATRPEQAQKILTDLSRTTSSALRDLKATVGLLRQTNDPDLPLKPAPGLAQLDDLTAAFGSAGLAVTVTTEGEWHELSPGVDLTAFRIVQEALTNVTKHASVKTAQVRLAYAHDQLTITVTDAGTASTAAPGDGYGLIGMRERARSIGGQLFAAKRITGGFEVVAELPVDPTTGKKTETHDDPGAPRRRPDAPARDLPDADRILR